jgi:hypothetical protein
MMNNAVGFLSIFALAIAPTLVLAGPGGVDCASPEVMYLNSTYMGDTSAPGYGNPVGGMGPLPSPANDAIYAFTANVNLTETLIVTAAGYNYGIFLTSNCAGTTAPPLQAATGPAVGGSLLIEGQSLVAGAQYFVIMSGNPSDSSAPAGTFTFTAPFVPVELRSFSIE